MADENGIRAGLMAEDPGRGTVIRIAKPEEGSSKGEFWAVLRAILFVICGILILSYFIA